MVWSVVRSVTSYATIVGLATQSNQFKLQTDYHVVQMTKHAAEAGLLQEAATADASEATALTESAASEQSEAAALQAKAVALETEAEALESQVALEQEEVAALEAQAAEEQVEADVAAARATADQVVVEEQSGVAAEATTAAAEYQAEEAEDGAAIILCEAIPLVDIACDVIGTIAAVSLETAVAAELAEAGTATAAALAAREDEQVELAQAVELETASAVHSESAVSLEVQAEAQQAQLVAEEEEAARDEAEVEALEAEAVEQEAVATEEEGKAEAEEEESLSSLKKSAQHGLQAAQNAVMSAGAGVLALAYFGVKVLMRTAVGFGSVASSGGSGFFGSHNVTYHLSYTAVHAVVFLFSASLLLNHVDLKPVQESNIMYSVRSQGGLVLLFGLIASFLQTLLVHMIPDAWSRRRYPAGQWFVLATYLVVLFVLEILIVSLVFGMASCGMRAIMLLHRVPIWVILIIMLGSAAIHDIVFVRSEQSMATDVETTIDVEGSVATERTSLLKSDKQVDLDQLEDELRTASYTWESLLFPFDLLGLLCLSAIFAACVSYSGILWNLLHPWLAGISTWVLAAVFVGYVLCTTIVLWWSSRS